MWEIAKGLTHLGALGSMIALYYYDKPIEGTVAGFGLLALGFFFGWIGERRATLTPDRKAD